MAMKMAPVLMKRAPGAIPRPERSLCPLNLDFGAAAARNFSGSLVNIFRVYSAAARSGGNSVGLRLAAASDDSAAMARNFSGSLVNIFRVYSSGAIYGRKGSSG